MSTSVCTLPKSIMRFSKSEPNDWGRPEYKRADLGELVRGKYAKRTSELTRDKLNTRRARKAAKKRELEDHAEKP